MLQSPAELSDASAPGLSQFGNLQIAGDIVINALDDFENVIGTAFGDVIFGNTENNVLIGGAGDDVMHPFGGDDFLDGGAGDLADQNVARDGAGGEAALLDVAPGGNVYVLRGTFEGNAAGAADALAEALAGGEDEGAGFFVFSNTTLNVARLIFAEDLDNVDGGIQQLANLGEARDTPDGLGDLAGISEANFSFDSSALIL